MLTQANCAVSKDVHWLNFPFSFCPLTCLLSVSGGLWTVARSRRRRDKVGRGEGVREGGRGGGG